MSSTSAGAGDLDRPANHLYFRRFQPFSLRGGMPVYKRLAKVLTAVIVTTTAMSLTGCGSLVARARIVGAETALGSARRANADTLAIYEFTSATLYLEKAREEESYGRFGNAIEWGGLAEELAEKAKLASTNAEPLSP